MNKFTIPRIQIFAISPLITHLGVLMLGFLSHELIVPSRTLSWSYSTKELKGRVLLPIPQSVEFVDNPSKDEVFIARKAASQNSDCAPYSESFKFTSVPGGQVFLIVPLAHLNIVPNLSESLWSKNSSPLKLTSEKPRNKCPQQRRKITYGS